MTQGQFSHLSQRYFKTSAHNVHSNVLWAKTLGHLTEQRRRKSKVGPGLETAQMSQSHNLKTHRFCTSIKTKFIKLPI